MRSQTLVAVLLGFGGLLCSVSAGAIPIPAPPQFAAKSYLLMDADSGQVLAAEHPDLKSEPASLTKLMTAYVVFHALKDGLIQLDTPVTISEKASAMGGSRTFLNVGSQVSVNDLLQGMIVQSGNDAAVALAERVGGTEAGFVQLMNHYARQLGMNDSHFVDASGLTNDPAHYMTARDVAIVSRAIINQFPQYYHYFAEKDFTWNRIHQLNRNSLLFSDPSVDGLKTGFTDDAGYCMVSSAKRDGMRLIAVVMGAKTEQARAQYSEQLLNYGFNFYQTHRLYAAGTVLAKLHAWKGAGGVVPVGVRQDAFVTIPKGSYASLKAKLETPAGVVAPVAAGTAAGELVLSVAGREIRRIPLYTLAAVPEGNVFRRWFDGLRLWLREK